MAVCQELAIPVRASIGYEGPVELPRVRMSSTELTQVLINVVANGAQAVAARGVPHGRVSIVARTDADMLEFQIRDDGIGLGPAAASPPPRTGEGLGVGDSHHGLVGMRERARLLGGRLRVTSRPGRGTAVSVRIPRSLESES